MNPTKGQFIEVRFNNGVHFDAIVEEWSDQKSVLQLIGSNDVVVIQKTLQDVLLVKISKISPAPKDNMVPVQEELGQLKNKPMTFASLNRMSRLAEENNKLERQEKLTNMTEFRQNGIREINYAIPGNIQVSSAAQYSEEEVATTDLGFDTQLQGLFRQDNF